MSTHLATLFYIVAIFGLFWLDRDERVKTSFALWIPAVWIVLACSRSVGQWMGMTTTVEASAQMMEGSPFDRAVYTSLLVLGLIVLVARGKRVAPILRANGPILLFYLYCALSLIWSEFPEVSFKRWVKEVSDLVMVLVIVSEVDLLSSVKTILARLSYTLIPISILFIKYYPDLGKGYGAWDYKAFYTGVTTNKNTLGVICLLFGLGAIWRITLEYKDKESKRRTYRIAAQLAVLGMVMWLFWMANSMTSMACFFLASPILIAANFASFNRKPIYLHALVAFVIGLSASALFLTTGLLQTIGRDPTLTDRTGIWSLALKISGNPLIGTGFESFWLGPRLVKMWTEYPWRPNQAHNGYLEIFLNLGWIGVALLILVITTGYKTVIQAYRDKLPTASLMVAYFAVGVVYNCTEASYFRIMAPAWIFFLLSITKTPQVVEEVSHAPLSKMRKASVPPKPVEESPARVPRLPRTVKTFRALRTYRPGTS